MTTGKTAGTLPPPARRGGALPRGRWVAIALAFLPSILLAQATGSLRGRIIDSETGEPVPVAAIRVRGVPAVSADSNGRFEVTGIPAGQAQVTIQALGYASNQWKVAITEGQTLDRQFPLDFNGESLPDLVVTARATKLVPRYADFEARRDRGLGAYLRWDEIKKKNYATVGEAARSVRGVRLNCIQEEFECYLRMARTPHCPPEWWVDGVNVRSFTENTPIRDVYGIEIYRGPGEVPGEFSGSNAGCGVIVIWTKSKPFR